MRMLSLYHMIDLEIPIATVVKDRDHIDMLQMTAINYKSVQTLKA